MKFQHNEIMSSKVVGKEKLKELPDSLGANAYDWLVSRITTFEIPVNTPLSEVKIAKEIGISRTPLREALHRLEAEGLVNRTDAGRFMVSMVSKKDIEDACDLLILCDNYLFQKASENLSPSQVKSLTRLSKELVNSSTSGKRDQWEKIDLEFHDILMDAANNPMVAEVTRKTRRRIHRYWTRTADGSKHLVDCSKDHVDLAKAVINKDSVTITRLVDKHIAHLREHILEIVAAAAPLFGI